MCTKIKQWPVLLWCQSQVIEWNELLMKTSFGSCLFRFLADYCSQVTFQKGVCPHGVRVSLGWHSPCIVPAQKPRIALPPAGRQRDPRGSGAIVRGASSPALPWAEVGLHVRSRAGAWGRAWRCSGGQRGGLRIKSVLRNSRL